MFDWRLWRSPAERRLEALLAGGVLICAALASEHLLGWPGTGTVLMALAALITGADIAVRAWTALRVRHVGIELLVTIAATGALAIGEVWEAAAVTFLFALGGYLETRTLSKTRRAIEALLEMAPPTAIVLRTGEPVTVSTHEVADGETVLVRPGDRVPVDGVVVSGHGVVDESAITGEPMPAEKQPGDTVFAGTLNHGGLLHVRSTRVGADTTMARIIRRVEEAQDAKAPVQRFIERFARVYTPALLLLSVLAYGLTRNVELALTLLVIGCPGALVIAIPVSVVAGIGRAAREGVLIKGGEHLERAGRITAVAFDKTGTLTEGQPRLGEVAALRVTSPGDRGAGGTELAVCEVAAEGAVERCRRETRELLWTAAIAETASGHPLARPIVEWASALGEVPSPERLDAVPGRGIRTVHAGARIDVGSVPALVEWGISIPPVVHRRVEQITRDGSTALLVAVDGALAGVLSVTDAPRANAARALWRLREVGVRRVIMLTGDASGAAHAVAGSVGIEEVHAALLPGEKLEWVRRLQAEGEVVAMVGDGINDAPALAQADVGIAMGAGGSDVAIETADIALMTADLEKVSRAIELSRRTLANMRQNVSLALLTVAALLAGVLAGEVQMAGGMLIHEISVLAVIANAMRLLRA